MCIFIKTTQMPWWYCSFQYKYSNACALFTPCNTRRSFVDKILSGPPTTTGGQHEVQPIRSSKHVYTHTNTVCVCVIGRIRISDAEHVSELLLAHPTFQVPDFPRQENTSHQYMCICASAGDAICVSSNMPHTTNNTSRLFFFFILFNI